MCERVSPRSVQKREGMQQKDEIVLRVQTDQERICLFRGAEGGNFDKVRRCLRETEERKTPGGSCVAGAETTSGRDA